jgi:hypothetical protein
MYVTNASVCVCVYAYTRHRSFPSQKVRQCNTNISGQRCGSMKSASARKPPTSVVSGYYGNKVTPSYISDFGSCFVSDLESTEIYCL